MALKSENPIYTMIKALLAKADRPLTCVDLIDDHELKTEAHRQVERSSNQRYRLDDIEQINRISDSLGLLWRKGELIRYPSTDPKTLARFSYELAKTETVAPKPIPSPPPPLRGRIPITINATQN